MIPAIIDFQILLEPQNLAQFQKGLKTTLMLCIMGNTISLIFGTLIGIAKTSKIKPVKYLASAYVEVFRNTPLLVQVYFFYYGLSLGSFGAGLFGLCTYTSAYMAEVIRAGIQSVPQSETKAAEALGIKPFTIIINIILPQAFRIIIPPMSNQLMNLTKNTAIVYFVALPDITYMFETITSSNFKYFEFFVLTVLTYMIICWCIALISYWIEKRLYVPGISSLEVGLEH